MFTLAYADTDARTHVSSRRALAEALGCSERLVSVMLIEKGNPGRELNGSYRLAAWKDYFRARRHDSGADAQGIINDELKAAVLREKRAKADAAELNLAALRRELIPFAEAAEQLGELAQALCALHRREFIDVLLGELCPIVGTDRRTLAALRSVFEKFHARFVAEVQRMKLK